MVTNVFVPMNFGIRLLDSPTHNTLELKASEGAIVKGSSVILSLNSPVIDNMTTTLHLTSVDVEEFSEQAVRCFVEASYTGETPAISRDTFRDINKMAHVFEVTWLVTGCGQELSQFADSILEPSYQDLLFLFEEAAFVLSKLKSRQLVDIALKKIQSLNWKEEFIGQYLEDVSTRSTYQLDLVIELAGNEAHFIVTPLIDQLVICLGVQGTVLPPNCKYLLQNSDLSLCQMNNTEMFGKLFDLLQEVTTGSSEDVTWVLQLLRRSSKTLVQNVKSAVATTSTKSDVSQHLPSNVIPNLFHTLDCNKSFDELVTWLGESKDVTNLFMFFEGLWTWMWVNDKANVVCTPAVLSRFREIKEKREWRKIKFNWVSYTYNSSYSDNFFKKLKACKDLVNYDDTQLWDLKVCDSHDDVKLTSIFLQETKLVFHFKHPAVKKCSKRGKCGFIIRTTPAKDGASMRLCTDPGDYSGDIHFHDEVRAENIHVVLCSRTRNNRDIPICWCGMPRVEHGKLSVDMLPVSWFNEDKCGIFMFFAL